MIRQTKLSWPAFDDAAADQPVNARFRITLGHLETEVDEVSAAAAIEAARRRWCQQLPRLWDVIQSKSAADFDVQAVES